jgi:hypothetical protein
MSQKAWNDLLGVSKGLWSVVQATNVSTRVRRMPRVPTQERLDTYSQNLGKLKDLLYIND